MSGNNRHSDSRNASPKRLSGFPTTRPLTGRIDSFLGGNPFSGITGHVVVAGAGPVVAGLLTRLEQRSELPPEVVVLVPPGSDTARLRDQLDIVGTRRRRVHVVVDDADDDTWDWIGLDRAAECVVLAGPGQNDLDVTGLAIEVTRRLNENDANRTARVIVFEESANAAGLDESVTGSANIYALDNLAAAALARMAANPDFAGLLDGAANVGVHASGTSGLTGTAFGELLPCIAGGVPVGMVGADGSIEFMPEPERELQSGEKLLVFAADDVAARRRTEPSKRPPLPSATVGAEDAAVPSLLIIGWDQVAAGVLRRWAAAGLPVSDVTVLSEERPDNFPADIPSPRHYRGDPADETELSAACDQLRPDVAIITGIGDDNESTIAGLRLAADGVARVLVRRNHPAEGWAQWAGSDAVELVSAADITASRIAGAITDPVTTAARGEMFSDRSLTFERIRINAVPEDQDVTLASLYMGLLKSRAAPVAVAREGELLPVGDPFGIELEVGDEVLLLSRRLP